MLRQMASVVAFGTGWVGRDRVTCTVHLIVCSLRVCVLCAGSVRKNTTHLEISFYMIPGRYVYVRYGTTQFSSTVGEGWRKVKVVRKGDVRETDFGSGREYSDTDDTVGWWVEAPPHICIYKFFLRKRILDIHPSLDLEE